MSGPNAASKNLLDHLVSLLPPPSSRILDVGFGQGASTKQLCERYGSKNVVGINIAPNQVEYARNSGVDCELHTMDAGSMEFPDESFDGILCMEAAFHFSSRLSFLKRAHHALRPGGSLVMSDLIFRSDVALDPLVFPIENQLNSLSEYEELFQQAGFALEDVSITDITNVQLVPFAATLLTYAGYLPYPDPRKININAESGREAILFILTRLLNISHCVCVKAIR